jgi:hypothetical protein
VARFTLLPPTSPHPDPFPLEPDRRSIATLLVFAGRKLREPSRTRCAFLVRRRLLRRPCASLSNLERDPMRGRLPLSRTRPACIRVRFRDRSPSQSSPGQRQDRNGQPIQFPPQRPLFQSQMDQRLSNPSRRLRQHQHRLQRRPPPLLQLPRPLLPRPASLDRAAQAASRSSTADHCLTP